MNIRNSIKAIIIRDAKLLVIVKKENGSVYSVLPGGGQEFGETMREALQRECFEETGLDVQVGELIFARDYIGKNHEFAETDSRQHQLEIMFLCEVINDRSFGKGKHPDSGQIDLQWVELSKLDESKLYPAILRSVIPDIGKTGQKIYLGGVN